MRPQKRTNHSMLRNRFWSWSVALASTFTASGILGLPCDPIWAQETEKGTDPIAQAEATEYDSSEFRKLLQTQKLDEAESMLEAALAAKPDDTKLWQDDLQLTATLLRANPTKGKKRAAMLLAQYESLESYTPSQASAYLSMLSLTSRIKDADAHLASLDKANDKLKEPQFIEAINSMKIQTLIQAKRANEAKGLLEATLEKAGDSKEFLGPASMYISVFSNEFADDAAKVEAKATEIANKLVGGDTIDAPSFMSYFGFMQSKIMRGMSSDPEAALETIDKIQAALEKVNEDDRPKMGNVAKSLDGIKSSVRRELERAQLIGQPAKDYADFAEHNRLIGMEDKSLGDFKGKVVLLDFWAVWCGPCIATFPHLIEWHEKYSEKGLVIIGSTSYYDYAWDDKAGKAVRSKDVDPIEELKMLEKFRESHGLHHGFLVTDKDINYGKHFLVSGIPQAVLIDKEGRIQMIRVGSGEKNAKDLHNKIEELLAQ
jgi:thiol-disulfide isomerase/thioredoxin